MTKEEFIGKMEGFYGQPLNPIAKAMTLGYLGEYKPEALEKLSRIVFKYHPINYGTPAIATIEKAHREYVNGDERQRIESHETLKVCRKVSACAPVKEEEISEEERKEVLQQMQDAGGLLGLIGQGGW